MEVSSKAEIDKIRKSGVRLQGPGFSLWYITSTKTKAHVLIPKKVVDSAIVRNRVRRVYVSVLRPFIEKNNLMVLVIVRKYEPGNDIEVATNVGKVLEEVV